MRFRTELHPGPSPFQLSLQQPMLSVGSCFADVIGGRLLEHKFKVLVNPFGTLFHPLPLVHLLRMSLDEQAPPAESYLYFQERWLNFLLHSSINAPDKESLVGQGEQVLQQVKESLLRSQALILTLGTSFVYELLEPSLTVANCHKQPQSAFNKRLVPAEESLEALVLFWQQLKKFNPAIKLILTVSPVRHLKDTLELNAVSKALLRVVCHQLVQHHPQEIYYFPSYELVTDDLRDYRFFNADLLHPNAQAEQYIWEKFTSTLLNQEAQAFVKEWAVLQQAINHRPFNPTSAAHRQFIEKTLQKLVSLPYPVDVREEITKLEEQLKK